MFLQRVTRVFMIDCGHSSLHEVYHNLLSGLSKSPINFRCGPHEVIALSSEITLRSESPKLGFRQISLKTLLLGTSCCCLVFATNRGEGLDYAWLAIQVATMIVGIGLWQQSTDVHALLKRETSLNKDVCRSIRFERDWHRVLCCCVFFGWTIAGMKAQGVFGEWDYDPNASFRIWSDSYAEGTAMLLLTIGMLNPALAPRRAGRSIGARVVHVVGGIAAAVVAVLVLRNVALIDGLVHIAIRGIEMAQAPPYDQNFYPGGVTRYEASARIVTVNAITLACATALNVALLVQLASRKNHRARIVLYVATVVMAGALAAWLRLVGFEALSPMLASTRSSWLTEVWYVAVPLVALFVLAASRRLISCRAYSSDVLTWRPPGKVYLSENWFLLIAVLIGALGVRIMEAWNYGAFWSIGPSGFGIPSRLQALLYVFDDPAFYLNLAVAFSALYIAWLRITGKSMPSEVPPKFSYRSFVATCIGILLSLYFAIEAAIWCSFAYTISPH